MLQRIQPTPRSASFALKGVYCCGCPSSFRPQNVTDMRGRQILSSSPSPSPQPPSPSPSPSPSPFPALAHPSHMQNGPTSAAAASGRRQRVRSSTSRQAQIDLLASTRRERGSAAAVARHRTISRATPLEPLQAPPLSAPVASTTTLKTTNKRAAQVDPYELDGFLSSQRNTSAKVAPSDANSNSGTRLRKLNRHRHHHHIQDQELFQVSSLQDSVLRNTIDTPQEQSSLSDVTGVVDLTEDEPRSQFQPPPKRQRPLQNQQPRPQQPHMSREKRVPGDDDSIQPLPQAKKRPLEFLNRPFTSHDATRPLLNPPPALVEISPQPPPPMAQSLSICFPLTFKSKLKEHKLWDVGRLMDAQQFKFNCKTGGLGGLILT